MKAIYSFLLLALLGLVGCQKGSDAQSDAPSGSPTHSVEVRPQAEPHLYTVHLKWKDPHLRMIHRLDPDGKEALHWVEEGETEYRDRDLRHGTFTYTFEGGEPTSIEIPQDRVLNATHEVSELTQIGRLFLGPKAELISGTEDLTITVDRLISDHAWIRAFPPDTPTQGRDAGQLKIRAQHAEGVLHVDRRGETGLAGRDGLPGASGRPGAPGLSARTRIQGYVTGETIDPNTLQPVNHKKTLQYIEHYLQKHGPGNPDVLRYVACVHPASRGSAGGPGGTGGAGQRGHQGGRQLAVDIQVEHGHSWQVHLEGEPGAGGPGGKPGPGGEGGAGGKNGQNDRFGACPPLPTGWGNPGTQGPIGEEGVRGKPGDRTPFCLRQGKRREGVCRQRT